jgi:hypothetical protein
MIAFYKNIVDRYLTYSELRYDVSVEHKYNKMSQNFRDACNMQYVSQYFYRENIVIEKNETKREPFLVSKNTSCGEKSD